MKPVYQSLEDVELKPLSWLWPNRIARGRITLIAGDPGLGKSWLTLDLAARVSNGNRWPDGEECEQGNVLIMNCEDDLSDTIKPRLQLLGADLNRVHALQGMQPDDSEDVYPVTLDNHDVIRRAIKNVDARLLVIDPISAYFGPGADSNRDTYIRSAFRPISSAADSTGCAVVIVAHLNKSSEQAALYRLSGSVQFSGASRISYFIGRDRGERDRILMMCVKNNIGPDRWALAYRIDPEHTQHPIQWEEEEITAENLEDIVTGSRESEDVIEAGAWLEANVKDPRGVAIKEIKKQTTDAGWGWQHVTRARRIKGLKQEQIDGVWYWLPADADPIEGRGWRNM